MKKYVKGEYIEMTAEDMEELKADIFETPPTNEERLEAIEAMLLEMVMKND